MYHQNSRQNCSPTKQEIQHSHWSLVVDDFGVKYTNKADADHLIKTIEKRYPITINWEPDFYLGMTMEWDYKNRTVTLSMPGYVKEALLKFQHATGEMKCTSPSPYTPPQYGKKYKWQKLITANQ